MEESFVVGCLITCARRLLLRPFLVYTLLLRQRTALLLQCVMICHNITGDQATYNKARKQVSCGAKNYDEKFLKRNVNRITNGNTSNSFGQKSETPEDGL
jgi:hypothetical protein